MRIKSTQKDLLKTIQVIQGVISTRTTLPILSSFLLTVKAGKISFFGTDLEVGIKCNLPGEIMEEGVTALPGRRVFELIKEFPPGEVEISQDKNIVILKSSKTRIQLNALPPDDYPVFPEIVGQKVNIKGDLLKSMIQKTVLAVSREESRYTLTGLYVLLKGDSIEMVGTDGRRLSLVEEVIDKSGVKQKKSCILPIKTCNEAVRIMGDEDVSLILGEKQANFIQKDFALTSRLIEGEFPDYNKVIPKNFQQKLMVNREDFVGAVTRAYVLTRDRGGSIKLDVQKNSMTISSKVPEVGESSEQITIKNSEKEMQIAFDPEYTLDALKVLDSEEVFLGLNSAKDAALFRPMDNEKFVYVLMPMEI